MAELDAASAATTEGKSSGGAAAEPPPPPPSGASSEPSPPPPPPAVEAGGGGGSDDDDMLLVTEFPPPPHYYARASRSTPSHLRLTPPEIPQRAFRVAAKRVAAERRRAREESERLRLEAEGGGATRGGPASGTSSEKGAEGSSASAGDPSASEGKEKIEEDDSIDPDDPSEPVVAVFGEIVEDPALVVEEECHDPAIVRENVRNLNRSVLRGFLQLVQKLVRDPNDNKKLRDELSHNLFLMLQECNKFREHQAREILIDALENQLERKREGVEVLRGRIDEAERALAALEEFRRN
ncbi:hypothetical protein ACHAWF_005323 [Thalassiosira exigua]